MTENFAALPRVKQILSDEDSEEPYVIFGSGFPKDQLFTQVKRCFLAFCYHNVSLYLSIPLCVCLLGFRRRVLDLQLKFHRFAATSTVLRSVWKPGEQ